MRNLLSISRRALALLMLCLLPAVALAQEQEQEETVGIAQPLPQQQEASNCRISIVGDFEPECLHLYEKQWYHNELPNTIIACQGMTVTYTVYAYFGEDRPKKWKWQVAGHESYTDNGSSITVTWGDGDYGQLTVTAYDADGNTCSTSVRVKLIEKPAISVATTPAYAEQPDGTKVIYVCKGETVVFTDQSSTTSTDIAGYLWESRDGVTASTANYTIEQVWGDGVVTHRVYNNCGCYDEEEYRIQVLEGEILELGCYGTVCQGATVTYTAVKPPCNQYFWHVDGGTIIGGQNTAQVTVQWDNPHDGYGVVSLDGSSCGPHTCPTLLSKKIPVITDGLAIRGQTTACVGEAVVYSIPLFGSTEYSWSVTPASGVTRSPVNGANELLCIFDQPGTYQVSVSYRCGFLECGEFTSEPLTVTVKPRLAITGEERVCVTNPCGLATSPAVAAKWTAYDLESGVTVATTGPQPTLATAFPYPGKFRVVASSAGYCEDAEMILTVQDAPPAPTVLDIDQSNPHTACRYDGVRLRANPQNPDHSIVWRPGCGDASPSEISGNDVTITYSGTVCNINAYTYDRRLGCLSATPYVQTVAQRTLAPIGIPHHWDVCPGSLLTWGDGDIPRQEGVLYEWTIQDNMQHCASVQGSHLENAVSLTVHEMSSGVYGYTFYVLLKRTVCQSPYFDTFYIHVKDHAPAALALAASPDTACPGTPITFTGTGGDPSAYRWRVDGRLVPFVGNPYVHSFSNPGTHRVTMLHNEMDECTNLNYYDSASVTVLIRPAPVIRGIGFDSHSVIADVAAGSHTYQWYYGGQPQEGETGPAMDTMGTGIYMCVVTNQWGCSASGSKFVGPSTSPTPGTACDMLDAPDTTYDFCGAVLHLESPVQTPPTIGWSCTGSDTKRALAVNPSDRHKADVRFLDVGTYYIRSYTSGEGCQVSSVTHTVRFIPQFTFEKRCDKIVIHNNSLSLHGDEHIKFHINGVDSCEFEATDKTFEYTVPAAGSYTFTLDIVVAGKRYTCEYEPVVISSVGTHTLTITTSNTNDPGKTCDNTPILLTVTPDPYFPVTSARWSFGDGSEMSGNEDTISHTFKRGSAYSVSVSVENPDGCTVNSGALEITSTMNEIKDYNLDAIGEMVCPGVIRKIQFKKDDEVLYKRDFYWDGASTPVQTYQYSTLQTGLYRGLAVSDAYCHAQGNINVKFKNAPTAIIVADKQEYCLGDKMTLYGATGPDSTDCSYSWHIENINTGSTVQPSTATVSLTPAEAGTYRVRLCVASKKSGCSSCSDFLFLTVHPAPAAPTIGYGPNRCMDNPPVILAGGCPLTTQIRWSNGDTGPTARYFTPGAASAWYYDPSTGCRSDEAHITIDAQPDFDALLTGCYEKCTDYFKDIHQLTVRGLTRGQQVVDWKWHRDGSTVGAGSGNYTYNPLLLNLPWFGEYWLDVSYNDNNCGAKSPTLTIREKERCDCEGLIVSYKYGWAVKDCHLYCDLSVTVCNKTKELACLKKFEPLFDQKYISIASNGFTGAQLASGNCHTFNITLDVERFAPSSVVSFRLHDDCHNCSTDFTVDLMPDGIKCSEKMEPVGYTIRPDLSNSSAAYIDFNANVAPSQSVLAFWSDPAMVVNHSYNGTSLVQGMLMLDVATLSRLAVEGGKVCLHAIVCDGDKLCERYLCIPANKIYQELKEMGVQARHSVDGTSADEAEGEAMLPAPRQTGTDGPRLVPNPATGEVGVAGTADEVAEVMVMDMNGRQVALFGASPVFDVSALAPGTYIVRLTTIHRTDDTPAAAPQKLATYLKLVKK